MSLKTWKAEFYSTAPKKNMSRIEAIEHSIRKWVGLLPMNLKKHKLHVEASDTAYIIKDGDSRLCLSINSSSCALCKKYLDVTSYHNLYLESCKSCPLAQTLGHPCDGGGGESRPYAYWMDTEDPRPMIRALKDALKNEAKQSN